MLQQKHTLVGARFAPGRLLIAALLVGFPLLFSGSLTHNTFR